MGFKMRVGVARPRRDSWWHPNAAAAPRVYKLAFRVGSAALEAA